MGGWAEQNKPAKAVHCNSRTDLGFSRREAKSKHMLEDRSHESNEIVGILTLTGTATNA